MKRFMEDAAFILLGALLIYSFVELVEHIFRGMYGN